MENHHSLSGGVLRLSLPTPSPGALSLLQRYVAIALQGEGRGNCGGGQQADKLLNEKAEETLEKMLFSLRLGHSSSRESQSFSSRLFVQQQQKVGFMQCFLSISTSNFAALQARFLPNHRPWLTSEYHKNRKKMHAGLSFLAKHFLLLPGEVLEVICSL